VYFEDTYPIFPSTKWIGICTVTECRHLMYMLGILVQVSVITWILSRFTFFFIVVVSIWWSFVISTLLHHSLMMKTEWNSGILFLTDSVDLFPVCYFAFINICLYTIPPSVFWLSFYLLLWGLLLNTWLFFYYPFC
jgi:hypothetical protein